VDYERLFLENLSTVERLARSIALRHRLPPDALEDFAGTVRLKLIEGDYRILREFEGRSSLNTYLTIVISRLFLDYRDGPWRRWRPSARAIALGPDAVLVEQLTVRDGHTLSEAIQIMRAGHQVTRSEAELRELWSSLPVRSRVMRVPEGLADTIAESDLTLIDRTVAAEERAAVSRALQQALDGLPAVERILLKLHFLRGVPLVHVATKLRLSKATIHRRMSRAIAACRAALTASGVDGARVHGLARADADDELSSLLDGLDETISKPRRLNLRDE
jgi:RNA polymerase sigma factor (sigma-70 family)